MAFQGKLWLLETMLPGSASVEGQHLCWDGLACFQVPLVDTMLIVHAAVVIMSNLKRKIWVRFFMLQKSEHGTLWHHTTTTL
ncbi:MAG: hypothetical protein A3K40_03350 [Syntrophobacterales bacterium RIFOXYC2_FULL_60_23]|nr:MAG: hypothetical protein A3K40_03350 [Syntrophobacterales bacterium RIFOXYC2_FULL_60_23]